MGDSLKKFEDMMEDDLYKDLEITRVDHNEGVIKAARTASEGKGGGLRYNTGKLRYDLQHPVATEGLVKVLTKGAEKYAPRNWERGMKWSDVIQSLDRHWAAFKNGEDYDPETGELHINHLQCNAHFLSAYYKIYPQGDDRAHGYLENVKIGLDIDEVLADWLGAWTELRGSDAHPKDWYFDRELMDIFGKMESDGVLNSFFMDIKPLIDPKDINFDVHCYITSRPIDSKITERWLDIHGFPARPVYTVSPGVSKVDIAKREGIEVFVDDSFANFKALNNAGICCFLMDKSHNRKYDVGFKRITNINDII
ncbi:5' nucleotidase [Cellulophaga phage Calle_1]|uniref:5' nucleotidase n=1 Tax=Cellulophaga phage Calle_1 TaxID=2745643 RepID=A0A8E4ZB18_9CAUD|nr:5' nucleotidase [Cellulophaga phage Calle_1]QQV89743.1 5' nucleotidase [Cellulophaga phage Calle_1]QQV89846.1 5' nucleotidase [Cellulophaga phage Calle_2]QQV89873.1 5' nucleotidase [Cellulophaga phage Calle_3]